MKWIVILAFMTGCVPAQTQLSSGEVEGVMDDIGAPDEPVYARWPEEYQALTVPYMRQLSYESAAPTITSELAGAPLYSRYIASYESEGHTIEGLLTVPTSPAPQSGYPAVVFVHGYIPPNSYVTTEKYEDYIDYLARNGLVVYKIDLRGHGASEGEPDGAYFSNGYVVDVLNARASLGMMQNVNPDKVGLWGHSMGGNVVLRAMAVRPEIHAGVIWAGAVYTYQDMREYGIQDSSYQPSQNPNRGRRSEMFEAVGDFGEENEFWNMVAPSTYLKDLSGLVQVHHAVNDPVVSVNYARNLRQMMEEAGTRYEVYEYDSGGHNLGMPAFALAMERSVYALQ